MSDHNYSCPPKDTNTCSVLLDHDYLRVDQHCNETCSIVFLNVDGRRRYVEFFGGPNAMKQDSLYARSDIVFFSETMLLDASSCLTNKDFFCRAAVATEGRPSGGLEIYSPPSEKGKIISQSDHHIVLETRGLYVVGVYYKPTLDLDDKLVDLLSALNHCSNKSKVVTVGGDFNIHDGSADFACLREIVSYYNLSLVSDPKIRSFIGPQGSSTPDHVFCSSKAQVKRCVTQHRLESTHQPITLELVLKSESPEQFEPKPLNIEVCREKLQQMLVDPHESIEGMVSKVTDAFESSQARPSKKKQSDFSHRISVLKEETKEAFNLYSRCNDPFFKEVYFRCRRELRQEITRHKRRLRENKVSKLIEDTESTGIGALYRSARPHQPNRSSQVPLEDWLKCYSELYQSFDEPSFVQVPSVPSEQATGLLSPFTEEEVHSALAHQSSKAPGVSSVSPAHLKALSTELAPLLTPIYNKILLEAERCPERWMETMFFFLHKKGSFSDPSNYRSLAIEDPFLKVFTTLLCRRLTSFSEDNGLLPEYQFGFRKNHSTTSATTILKQCVLDAFKQKKRLHACFIDYKKAFDLVDRELLCKKLQLMGIPTVFSRLIYNILTDMRFRIRSNGNLSSPFEGFNGVPQGDPLSPLLFSLFTADLPEHLSHSGALLNNGVEIKYLLYADDLVLLSNDPDHLQTALGRLHTYVTSSKLTVNVAKTKCLTFFQGFYTKRVFIFNGVPLENCSSFTYLGIVFTPRLSAASHIKHVLAKCKSRVAVLFTQLPMRSIPLAIALQIFNTYVLPIVTYCVSVWFSTITRSGIRKLNALFTKFLKRCFGLPYRTHNSLVHFLSGTIPLCHFLQMRALKDFHNVVFPRALLGVQFQPPPVSEELKEYNAAHEVPSFFWMSRVIDVEQLPRNSDSRRALLYDALDLFHTHVCIDGKYHTKPSIFCICRFCDGLVHQHYHHRTCPSLAGLSPSAVMRKVTSAGP